MLHIAHTHTHQLTWIFFFADFSFPPCLFLGHLLYSCLFMALVARLSPRRIQPWLHATGGTDTREECVLSRGFVSYNPLCLRLNRAGFLGFEYDVMDGRLK